MPCSRDRQGVRNALRKHVSSVLALPRGIGGRVELVKNNMARALLEALYGEEAAAFLEQRMLPERFSVDLIKGAYAAGGLLPEALP